MDGSITNSIKMKMIAHNLKYKYIFAIVFLIGNFNVLFAQDTPVFDDNVVDNPVTPIDNYIIPMLVMALIFGAVLIKRKSITCLK